MKKLIISAALSVMAFLPSMAATVTYSYVPDGAPELVTGLTGATHYEAAMRVDDATLSGSSIAGAAFRLNVAPEDVKSVKIWLTRRLSATPSITAEAEGTVDADGNVTATFDAPVTLSGANIYVGYTLELATAVSDPVVAAPVSARYGMYLRTSATGDWETLGDTMSLYLDVLFDGNFPENGAQWQVEDINVLRGKPGIIEATLANRGANAINSVDYRYVIGARSVDGHIDFTTPVGSKYGSSQNIAINVEPIDEYDAYNATLEVLKINGVEAPSSTKFEYSVLAYIPVHRPLMEEYSGTWCGNCPRGAAAMERLSDLLGDRFVGVALHFGANLPDPMQVLPSSLGASGYPIAKLDRDLSVDPYFGSPLDVNKPFYIENDYALLSEKFTPAAISLSAEWTDETCTRIEAKTRTSFVKKPGAGTYRVGYILVQDGLKAREGEQWAQHNYFSGAIGWDFEPYMRYFINAPEEITDMVYNHVAVLYPSFVGITNSLPATIEPNVEYEHTYVLDLEDAVNIFGENLIDDKSKLHVIAFVYTTSGSRVLNSIEVHVPGEQAKVQDVASEAPVVQTILYDLSGRRASANPTPGIYVEKSIREDGTSSTRKTIIRK